MALSSREVLRVAKLPTVSHDPICMTFCGAVTNDPWTPPFMPRYRNEDGLFARMLMFMRPDTDVGHIPYGVFHDSDRASAYDPTTIHRPHEREFLRS